MNSKIFMITPTVQDVAAGSVIQLTQIARRVCQGLTGNANNVTALCPGYYKVTATITFTAPAAGDVVIELQKNNVAVPGIVTSGTVTTATTEVNTLTLTGIVRVFVTDGPASLSLVNTGVAITPSNVAFVVEGI